MLLVNGKMYGSLKIEIGHWKVVYILGNRSRFLVKKWNMSKFRWMERIAGGKLYISATGLVEGEAAGRSHK